MVLLVIDTQNQIMNEKLFSFSLFQANVKELISVCRAKSIEVIYVRHDDGADGELVKGTKGFEISAVFQPMPGERIFDKKVNSAFKDSGLLEYLRIKNETTLMIAGLQTDYCINATIQCGFEHGFQIYVPAYCNTTVSNEYLSAEQSYHYYNEKMWNGRYATCLELEDALRMIGK